MTAPPCLTVTMRRMECVQSSGRPGTLALSGFQLGIPRSIQRCWAPPFAPSLTFYPYPRVRSFALSVSSFGLRPFAYSSVSALVSVYLSVYLICPFARARVYEFTLRSGRERGGGGGQGGKLAGIKSFNLATARQISR